jgi:hypothetical protein
MVTENEEIELRVQAAVADLFEQEKPKLRATAREFDVPYGRLWRRWTESAKPVTDQGGHNKAIGEAEEAAIC